MPLNNFVTSHYENINNLMYIIHHLNIYIVYFLIQNLEGKLSTA